jgi:hypothetical protein
MTMPPTTRPTTLPTEPSKVVTLVTVELEAKGDFYRLRAFGHPLHGVRRLHEWRFRYNELTAGILDEVGAMVDELTVAALLAGIGAPLELALDLQEALGSLREASE